MIIWKSFIKIDERSFEGKNPPDEITVIARFSELNDLIPKIFKIIKIDIVNPEYNKRILIDCFKISEELKDKKLVKEYIFKNLKPELVEKKDPPIITSKIYIKCKLVWSTSSEIPIFEILLTKDKNPYVKLVS